MNVPVSALSTGSGNGTAAGNSATTTSGGGSSSSNNNNNNNNGSLISATLPSSVNAPVSVASTDSGNGSATRGVSPLEAVT